MFSANKMEEKEIITDFSTPHKAITHAASVSGLRVKAFKGLHHVQELECSGEDLDSDTNVLLMTLFSFPSDKTIASANLGGDQCSTSAMFSSCVLDRANSRRTRIRTLLLDFRDGDVLKFGCNVTTARSGGRAYFISWSLTVKITSKL